MHPMSLFFIRSQTITNIYCCKCHIFEAAETKASSFKFSLHLYFTEVLHNLDFYHLRGASSQKEVLWNQRPMEFTARARARARADTPATCRAPRHAQEYWGTHTLEGRDWTPQYRCHSFLKAPPQIPTLDSM